MLAKIGNKAANKKIKLNHTSDNKIKKGGELNGSAKNNTDHCQF